MPLPSSPVAAIVTGIEHSGTTHLGNLLRCHPSLSGGLECGVLLGDSPADFPGFSPFYEWMMWTGPGGWGISPDQMDEICRSRSWNEMYRGICRYSPPDRSRAAGGRQVSRLHENPGPGTR